MISCDSSPNSSVAHSLNRFKRRLYHTRATRLRAQAQRVRSQHRRRRRRSISVNTQDCPAQHDDGETFSLVSTPWDWLKQLFSSTQRRTDGLRNLRIKLDGGAKARQEMEVLPRRGDIRHSAAPISSTGKKSSATLNWPRIRIQLHLGVAITERSRADEFLLPNFGSRVSFGLSRSFRRHPESRPCRNRWLLVSHLAETALEPAVLRSYK